SRRQLAGCAGVPSPASRLKVNQKQVTARNRTRDTHTEKSRPRPQFENLRADIEMKPGDELARRQDEATKRQQKEECELMGIGSASAQPTPSVEPFAGYGRSSMHKV